jgi:Putative Flp pilus-assembly TadE/G-like
MRFITRVKGEEGQAVIAVAVAMSFFLVAAIGLGIDGSNLYAQRQMAQTAADAAALSAIQSVFNGTYNGSGNPGGFSLATFTCSTTGTQTPCVYARNNGFGGSASDTVTMSFPNALTGVTASLAGGFPANLATATVSRSVNTTLLRLVRFVAPTATTVTATATAAIVSVLAPVPILVTHPFNPSALNLGGNGSIEICGGPSRSIQVNSRSGTSVTGNGTITVKLQYAGPNGNSACTALAGADFGNAGGPIGQPSFINVGSGTYLSPDDIMQDPLKDVPAPPDPGTPGMQTPGIGIGTDGCPAYARGGTCTLYSPGDYPNGLTVKNQTALFAPGIYYVQGGGVNCTANCDMLMATGAGAPTYTDSYGTIWSSGMLIYNTGVGTGNCNNPGNTYYCPFNLGADGVISLVGSPIGSTYKNILFFEDRTAPALQHSLQGGGAITLIGTLYMTNPRATMTATLYQSLSLGGNSGNNTTITGEIIVGELAVQGTPTIVMNLSPQSVLKVSQIALVK